MISRRFRDISGSMRRASPSICIQATTLPSPPTTFPGTSRPPLLSSFTCRSQCRQSSGGATRRLSFAMLGRLRQTGTGVSRYEVCMRFCPGPGLTHAISTVSQSVCDTNLCRLTHACSVPCISPHGSLALQKVASRLSAFSRRGIKCSPWSSNHSQLHRQRSRTLRLTFHAPACQTKRTCVDNSATRKGGGLVSCKIATTRDSRRVSQRSGLVRCTPVVPRRRIPVWSTRMLCVGCPGGRSPNPWTPAH